MPRFAANLSLLFTERPFLERFAAARAAGFAPGDITHDKTRQTLIENLRFAAAVTRRAGIELVLEPWR